MNKKNKLKAIKYMKALLEAFRMQIREPELNHLQKKGLKKQIKELNKLIEDLESEE